MGPPGQSRRPAAAASVQAEGASGRAFVHEAADDDGSRDDEPCPWRAKLSNAVCGVTFSPFAGSARHLGAPLSDRPLPILSLSLVVPGSPARASGCQASALQRPLPPGFTSIAPDPASLLPSLTFFTVASMPPQFSLASLEASMSPRARAATSLAPSASRQGEDLAPSGDYVLSAVVRPILGAHLASMRAAAVFPAPLAVLLPPAIPWWSNAVPFAGEWRRCERYCRPVR